MAENPTYSLAQVIALAKGTMNWYEYAKSTAQHGKNNQDDISTLQSAAFSGATPGWQAAIDSRWYVADTSSSTTTYTGATKPTATGSDSLFAGYFIIFKPATNNTGASTLNVASSDGAVNIKKISFGAKAALAAGDLDSDTYAELIFDGTDWVLLNPPASVGGRKNIIINGGMKVWQRSASEAAVAAGYNTADRWYTTITAGGVWTQSKATGTAGFASAIKMDCTTADGSLAAGDRLMLSYNIEGQDLQHLKKGTASAESVTLSFWVKSPKTGTHIIEVYDNDNSRHICQAYTVSSADTWEQKTLTFAGDTTGAFGDDVNNSCTIQFYMAAGSNYTSGTLATSWAASSNVNRAVGQVNCADSTSNDFYLTGVQLELGTAATDFEYRSYGEELALCQRYVWVISNANGQFIGTGHCRSTTVAEISISPKVSFRHTPTLIISDATKLNVRHQATDSASSAVIIIGSNEDMITLQITTGAVLTAGEGCSAWVNGAAETIEFNVEL